MVAVVAATAGVAPGAIGSEGSGGALGLSLPARARARPLLRGVARRRRPWLRFLQRLQLMPVRRPRLPGVERRRGGARTGRGRIGGWRHRRGWCGPVKVLLRSDVDGVGRRGDVVDVAGGFARNYLLPGGKALVATEGVEAQAAAMRRSRDLREAKDRESAEAQAQILSGTVLQIEARAGTAGRLFGSVGPADVVDAAKAQRGVELDRRHVKLDEPIKAVGSYEVVLNLFSDVTAVVRVEVTGAG